MKKTQYLMVFSLFLMCLLMVSVTSSATVSIEPPATTISPGTTTDFTVVLDSVPNGLAGYSLNLSLSNPDIAVFGDVSYPSWASLNNVTYPSKGVVRLSGVDIGREIQPGAGTIVLGTVTIRGTGTGSTTISISSVRMDAPGGASINHTVSTSQLTVQGVASPGGAGSGGYSYSGGGGGSAGSGGGQEYTGSTATSGNATVVQEPTAATREIITTPDVTVYASTGATPASSIPVSAPLPVISTIPSPVVTQPAGTPTSLPWVTLIEIILVIGITGAALALYFIKKAELL